MNYIHNAVLRPACCAVRSRKRRGQLWRFLLLLVLVFILMAAAGCGRDREEEADNDPTGAGENGSARAVPTFTPTPEAAGARSAGDPPANPGPTPAAPPTPVPTATSTPLPTATSTPAAATVLAEASQLHRIGRTADERLLLARVIADPQSGVEMQLDAWLRLVESFLVDDDYGSALESLERFQNQARAAGLPTEDRRLGNAEFLRGEALSGLGRNAEAVAAYTRALSRYPELSRVIQETIAQVQVDLGNAEAAAAAYREAASAAWDLADRFRLLEALARVLRDSGRHGEAADVYDEILVDSQVSSYRASILHQAGLALAAAGDQEGAIDRWRRATEADPTSSVAYSALIELVDRNVSFDLYQRGYIDLQAGAYIPAINAYERYLQEAPADDGRRGQALHGIGQSQIGLGNYAAAIATFERVFAEYPECGCVGQAWLDKARAEAAAGDGSLARRTYRTFAREYAADGLAPEALWQSALSARREGNELEAATDLLALADGFPGSQRAPAALYSLGIGFFTRGLYTQAADSLDRLQTDYPENRWQAVHYWLGRAHYAGGELAAGQAQWQALVRREPHTYYGILAAQALSRPDAIGRDIVTGAGGVAGPASTQADDDGSQAYAERWLSGWIAETQAPLSALPPAIAEGRDLRAGRLLLELDRRGDALAALDRIYQQHQDDAQALYALSLEFERLGAYQLSILSMSRLMALSPARLLEESPIFLQERIYPRHFAQLIESEAAAHGLDALLLFSLIRQESLFEEGARSVAAAQGLAQVIPDTGRWIADRLSFPGYTNDLIYRPYINVRFGAYYLDWARGYLDGDLVSALVGYNAGPGNARTWREAFGQDDTLFVELLTINEPRLYVQLITTNFYHYSRLYRGRVA